MNNTELPCSFCLSCYADEYADCDSCELPENSKDGECYRDTCDVCGNYMMVPNTARDNVNVVVCKTCAKDTSDPLDFGLKGTAYGDCEGVYVEGTRKWW